MDNQELLDLGKQCLSIASSATLKDDEIEMWVEAAIKDLERQAIKIDLENPLVKGAIIMYLKANFGMVDIKEKELAQKTYNSLCANLSLSSDFKEVDKNA